MTTNKAITTNSATAPRLALPADSRLRDADFIFGVATSAFQIEGGAETRESSIWDDFCQQPGRIKDGSDGIIACAHVEKWQEDIELMQQLGVDAYRFSIAWGRVIRADGSVNPDGLAFYQSLVEQLNSAGIKPFVTLYHWDLPSYLQAQGGWLNRQTAYAFASYAEVIAKALGDKVYSYTTLNEPFCSAYLGYEVGIHAPGESCQKQGRQVAHHLLLAHGLAMTHLRAHAPKAQHGIVLNCSPFHAASDSPLDQKAAQQAHEYHNLWYLQPLLTGQYPKVLEQFNRANLPEIKPGDLTIIQQPLDFIGINYYTRHIVQATPAGWFEELPPPVDAELTAMGWEVYPQGLTEILMRLDQEFANLPPILITENGAAFADAVSSGTVADIDRIRYFQSHLNAVDQAARNGVKINGYFAWSLLDNFEWAEGYTKRFGLVYVDFTTQQRVLKQSALAYQHLLQSRHNQN